MSCRFVLKLLRDRQAPTWPNMLILGDERQSIYGFRSSDFRYLTLAHRGLYDLHTNIVERKWRLLPLDKSYRATPSLAAFVNDAMLGFDCLTPGNTENKDEPVQYLVGNPLEIAKWLVDELIRLLKAGAYAPEDIFMLAPSIKAGNLGKKTPLQELENELVL